MIRRPVLEDVDDLNELTKKSWIEGFSDVLSDEDVNKAREKDDFVTEERLTENIGSDGSLALVYEKDGKVVGKGRVAWTGEETHGIVDVSEDEVQLRSFYVPRTTGIRV